MNKKNQPKEKRKMKKIKLEMIGWNIDFGHIIRVGDNPIPVAVSLTSFAEDGELLPCTQGIGKYLGFDTKRKIFLYGGVKYCQCKNKNKAKKIASCTVMMSLEGDIIKFFSEYEKCECNSPEN